MDFVVATIAGIALLTTISAAILLFIRWRRNRYRFSLRTLILSFTLLGFSLYAIMRFVVPVVTHRWAVQQIYYAGGLLFRDDFRPNSGQIYSDPRTANPWREVGILHARNDAEAITIAHQLKFLPETDSVFLSSGVTDQGLIAICDSEPMPLFGTLDLLESPVTVAGLSRLAKLKQLHTLFVNTCPLDDTCLSSLKLLESLRNLTLLEEGQNKANPNRFTEAGFREIGDMKNLESLWLVELQISSASANQLKNLTQLKLLKLSRCLISDNSIAELRKSLPKCKIEIYSPDATAPGK